MDIDDARMMADMRDPNNPENADEPWVRRTQEQQEEYEQQIIDRLRAVNEELKDLDKWFDELESKT